MQWLASCCRSRTECDSAGECCTRTPHASLPVFNGRRTARVADQKRVCSPAPTDSSLLAVLVRTHSPRCRVRLDEITDRTSQIDSLPLLRRGSSLSKALGNFSLLLLDDQNSSLANPRYVWQARSLATRKCESSCSAWTQQGKPVRTRPRSPTRLDSTTSDSLSLPLPPHPAILYKLKLNQSVTTIPTVGFNVETVTYKNVK